MQFIMNKFLVFAIISVASCCGKSRSDQSSRQSESDQKSASISADALDETSNLNDETGDVAEYFYEGSLMESLPKDSLIVQLDNTGEIIELQGQKLGDQFLFEGDIIVNRPDTNAYGLSVGITTMNRKWRKVNGKVMIPYEISPSLPNKERVLEAIKLWETSTDIMFVRWTSQLDYVYFVKTDLGCFVNQVGMAGGQQLVSLSNQCKIGNVVHEIGHVLGLYHEQTRSDRDTYVNINLAEAGGWASQFKYAKEADKTGKPVDVGDYDFNSIMHYPERSYFQVKPAFKSGLKFGIPGQRDSLSKGDIDAIKNIYAFQ